MEVSGTVLKHVTNIAGAGTNNRSLSRQSFTGCGSVTVGAYACIRGVVRGVRVSSRPGMLSRVMGSGFRDDCHLQYYQASTTMCRVKDEQKGSSVLTTKKKMKLLKRLMKGMPVFSDLGFAMDSENRNLLDEVQGTINLDAAEALLQQLKQLRAEEKELEKKRKQEKAKLKPGRIKTKSSSESSDSDCGQVVNMNSLRTSVAPAKVDELQLPVEEASMLALPILPSETQTSIEEKPHACDRAAEFCTRNDIRLSSNSIGFKDESNVATSATPKRIEVCMGKKCERSGAAALLQEFEKVVGVEGVVVGCKCMGKCRSAPNVRVKNSVGDGLANPLCNGVGLEDVATILANFFVGRENHNNVGLAAPTIS